MDYGNMNAECPWIYDVPEAMTRIENLSLIPSFDDPYTPLELFGNIQAVIS
jgi:hypothetical protein